MFILLPTKTTYYFFLYFAVAILYKKENAFQNAQLKIAK